jgi:hypothetical protein
VGTQALFDVLTTIGERGVDAVVLILESTPCLGQRDIDCVLRSLNRRPSPHTVIVNVDSHPRSRPPFRPLAVPACARPYVPVAAWRLVARGRGWALERLAHC